MPSRIKNKFRCVLHGSFRKHFEEIKYVHNLFSKNGIEVLAPTSTEIKSVNDGFAVLEGDSIKDPQLIELLYLQHLKRLGELGFSYFVNPDGYIGPSAAYELGIAQVSNVPCFFYNSLIDHPAYIQSNSIITPESLIKYIKRFGQLPGSKIQRHEKTIHKLWTKLMVPGSVVAVGGIIEFDAGRAKGEKDILLVKTHKWQNKYSIVGGRVWQNERLDQALLREIKEETGLVAKVGRHICTFDQIKNSGYYRRGVQHVFVDKVVQVASRRVRLNDEAQEYIWLPARVALRDLDIEPNAKQTLRLYTQLNKM